MATEDELDNSEKGLAKPSSPDVPRPAVYQAMASTSGKELEQISSPSNFNTHAQLQVNEGKIIPKNLVDLKKQVEEIISNWPNLEAKSLKDDPLQLCKTSSEAYNRWTIYKVPHRLRQVNEKAYEPNVISIGPYHHGKKHLKAMEDIKKSFFSRMIEETNREHKEFVSAMKDMEKEARECYSDSESVDHFDSDAFVKMMILDGCFIVQLFRNIYSSSSYCFLELTRIVMEIYYDLLLLENQLPFDVLWKLYGMIEMANVGRDDFARFALAKLKVLMPGGIETELHLKKVPENIKHLLGLVHDSWLPDQGPKHKGAPDPDQKLSEFIGCASELNEAGIKFEKKDNNVVKDQNGKEEKGVPSLFHINFTNDAKLKIPTLNIDDNTELIFRNLIAYEQFIPDSEQTYVSDYVVFMDNLINSGEDVQLLRDSKVIVNWLGDDEAVAQMFNRLCDFTYSADHSFYYKEIYEKVMIHCGNKWKAKLNKDYFNSPWSVLSVLAAIFFLLLTLQQSIFSVLSYNQ